MLNKTNFKFLLIIILLLASSFAFCKDKGPTVVCMVVYANKLPTMMNISYKEDTQKSRLEEKVKKLEKAFKGKFEILETDETTKGITCIINDTKIEPGKGSSIEPFVNTFSDEKHIILIFTGDFELNKDPLILYTKDDFSIMGNISDTTYQYEIKSKGNKKSISLPKGQKSITFGKVAKTIGIIILWLIVGIIVIFIMVILTKRSIKKHKTRK